MRFLAIILVTLFSSQVFGETAINNKELNFSYEIPRFPNDGFGIVAHHYLPVRDGFQPNINIVRQNWTGEADAFLELSLSQFTSLGFEPLSSSVDGQEIRFSYTGLLAGMELRWYARAIVTSSATYLVTATAKQSHWDLVGEELINNVNSFELKE